MCFKRSSERIEGKSRPPHSGWKIVWGKLASRQEHVKSSFNKSNWQNIPASTVSRLVTKWLWIRPTDKRLVLSGHKYRTCMCGHDGSRLGSSSSGSKFGFSFGWSVRKIFTATCQWQVSQLQLPCNKKHTLQKEAFIACNPTYYRSLKLYGKLHLKEWQFLCLCWEMHTLTYYGITKTEHMWHFSSMKTSMTDCKTLWKQICLII